MYTHNSDRIQYDINSSMMRLSCELHFIVVEENPHLTTNNGFQFKRARPRNALIIAAYHRNSLLR